MAATPPRPLRDRQYDRDGSTAHGHHDRPGARRDDGRPGGSPFPVGARNRISPSNRSRMGAWPTRGGTRRSTARIARVLPCQVRQVFISACHNRHRRRCTRCATVWNRTDATAVAGGRRSGGRFGPACKAPPSAMQCSPRRWRGNRIAGIAAAEIESRSLRTRHQAGNVAWRPRAVRSAWERAANAWEAASVFRDGPLANEQRSARAASQNSRGGTRSTTSSVARTRRSRRLEGSRSTQRGSARSVTDVRRDAHARRHRSGARRKGGAWRRFRKVAKGAPGAADVVNTPRASSPVFTRQGCGEPRPPRGADGGVDRDAVRRGTRAVARLEEEPPRDVEGARAGVPDLAVARATATGTSYLRGRRGRGVEAWTLAECCPRGSPASASAVRASLAATHALERSAREGGLATGGAGRSHLRALMVEARKLR
jgi:hypothetical protein